MASLQELPDDELDKLFRSSAEEFEPPYNPDDWNSLRRRLDDDDRSRFLDRFIYWGLPLLLLLLTAVSLLVPTSDADSVAQTNAQQLTRIAAGETEKTAPAQKDAPTGSVPTETDRSASLPTHTDRSEPDSDAPGQPEASGSEPRQPETDAETRAGDPNAEKAPGTRSESATAPGLTRRSIKPEGDLIIKSRSAPTNTVTEANTTTEKRPMNTEMTGRGEKIARTRAEGRSRNQQSRNRETFGNRENAGGTNGTGTLQNRPNRLPVGSETTPHETAGIAEPRTDLKVTGDLPETEPFYLTANLAYIAARPLQKPALRTLPELDLEPLLPPVVTRTVPTIIPVIGYPALSVRIVAAPDLNFVGKSTKGAKDFQVGALAEYRFLRRFTVQAGVLRSVKKYRAAASDYTKPDHWYGPMYESVDAVCTVLDIPVNLRFDFLLNDRRRWFISSGVSSYIMQEEQYKYNYPHGVYPQPKYKEWYGKTGFHKWSHLNLSFGYERNFRAEGPLRRLSWQVEPFLKNPLTDLGYGKIRLKSTGVFFSLRYRL